MLIESLALVLALCVSGVLLGDSLAPQPGEQVVKRVKVKTTGDSPHEAQVPLLLYAPPEYKAEGDAWPLVLFLHGLGESGDGSDQQIERVAVHGPPKQAAAGRQLPFVLASPQCKQPSRQGNFPGAWQADELLALLDRLVAELNIDPQRVYVTGLSMGGYGTWRLAAAAPERFAAAAPICGGGQPDAMAKPLVDLPIWAFHGDKDAAVKLDESAHMIRAIRAAGGHPRLTVYPGVGHDSWTQTFDNPMFYDWLLGERRR